MPASPSISFADNPKEQPPSYEATLAAPSAAAGAPSSAPAAAASGAAEAGYSGANSRRSSTAEFQERPPMSFASGAGGSRRGSRHTLGSKQHRKEWIPSSSGRHVFNGGFHTEKG